MHHSADLIDPEKNEQASLEIGFLTFIFLLCLCSALGTDWFHPWCDPPRGRSKERGLTSPHQSSRCLGLQVKTSGVGNKMWICDFHPWPLLICFLNFFLHPWLYICFQLLLSQSSTHLVIKTTHTSHLIILFPRSFPGLTSRCHHDCIPFWRLQGRIPFCDFSSFQMPQSPWFITPFLHLQRNSWPSLCATSF